MNLNSEGAIVPAAGGTGSRGYAATENLDGPQQLGGTSPSQAFLQRIDGPADLVGQERICVEELPPLKPPKCTRRMSVPAVRNIKMMQATSKAIVNPAPKVPDYQKDLGAR